MLARDPLAVVVEVGCEPEIGVVRSRLGDRLLDDLLLLLLDGKLLVGHDVFASSSSITS
jgi:hypothetical protein